MMSHFSIALLETERHKYNGKPCVPFAYRADPLLDVVNVVEKGRIAGGKLLMQAIAQELCDLWVWAVICKDLKGQILCLFLRLR